MLRIQSRFVGEIVSINYFELITDAEILGWEKCLKSGEFLQSKAKRCPYGFQNCVVRLGDGRVVSIDTVKFLKMIV